MRELLEALLGQNLREPARQRIIDADGTVWTNAMLVDAIAAIAAELESRPHVGPTQDAGRPPGAIIVSTGTGGSFWAAFLAVVAGGRDAVPVARSAPRGVRDRLRRTVGPVGEIGVVATRGGGCGAEWLAARLRDPTWQPGGMVLHSSGTTGRSRFVRRSPSGVVAIGRGLVASGLFGPDDIVGSFLPMHHAFGFEHAFLGPLLGGSSVRLGRILGPIEAFELLARGVTVLPLAPTAAAALAENPWPQHRLRQLVTAGSPLRVAVRKRLESVAGLAPVDLYGATELGTIWLDRGYGGEPVDGVEVRIADPKVHDAIEEIRDGEQGEVVVRSETRYERLLGESIEDDHVDGWFRTGDLGVREARGRFRVTGRLKLVFDVGGLKVNPYDVESAIEEHPSVRLALVEPIVVGSGLARVAAEVELREVGAVDAVSLREFLAERVPTHAIPRSIRFVDALPRTSSGKVLRTWAASEVEGDADRGRRSPVQSRPRGLDEPCRREAWTRDLFDSTASAYDLSTGAAFLGSGRWYRRRVLLRAGLRRGMALLDVGSGTGLCASLAAEIVGEAGRVVSLDPSPGMLAVARERGVSETILGHAEQLPFPDGSFDMVTMSYMLRHVDNLGKAFSEARRVLRPLGRIVILEVTRPERGVARCAFRVAMRHLVPAVGVVASGRPSAFPMIRYWADTIEVATRPASVVGALEDAGFVGVRHVCELGVFSYYRAVAPS